MAFWVGQPCLRVTAGLYERLPYPKPAFVQCAEGGGGPPVQDAVFK